MAVELMMDCGSDGSALREAASAGIKSVENLIELIAQPCQDASPSSPAPRPESSDIEAATDAAVNKFRKVISLLDRSRTGHARFRRASAAVNPPEQGPNRVDETARSGSSAFKVYCPASIQRLPPLPHNQNPSGQKSALPVAEKKDSVSGTVTTTINFAPPQQISNSAANSSFLSSLTTGKNDSVHRSLSSSGFQINHQKPPLSMSSSHITMKRKCSSRDDGALKCRSSSSGRCHCSKKRSVQEDQFQVKRSSLFASISFHFVAAVLGSI